MNNANLRKPFEFLTSIVQNLYESKQHSRIFKEIRKVTNGYLPPDTYRQLYTEAINAHDGVFVDIGPAQGGSTISLALGLHDSGKIGPIYSIDCFCNSAALQSWHDQKLNVNVLRDNLNRFGVLNLVNILAGRVEDVQQEIPEDCRIGLLFIDADGALDRDFNYFFNRLVDHASIVIDDYVDIINRHARERYLKWQTRDEMNRYVNGKGATNFFELCPLGKEYTTFRFINFFITEQLIVPIKLIRNTLFARKVESARFDPDRHISQLVNIRKEIERTYYRKRDTPLLD